MSNSKDEFWASGSMDKDDMGETIKLIRKWKELNQEEFANDIGCTLQLLKSSENGKGAHVYGTLMKACEKYNLDTNLSISEGITDIV